MDNFGLSLTVLITGFVVVFAILLLLIGSIKLYGTIVYNAQQKNEKKKKEEQAAIERSETEKPSQQQESVETFENGLTGEIIAVITAAVDSMYSSRKVRIKSIRKTRNRKSAWHSAGVSDNTSPF